MKNKVTPAPGPWQYAESKGGKFYIYDHDGNIVSTPRRKQRTKAEIATFHLIAAAPELLEALRNLLKRIDVYFAPEASPDWIAQTEARAAIAKAEGRHAS